MIKFTSDECTKDELQMIHPNLMHLYLYAFVVRMSQCDSYNFLKTTQLLQLLAEALLLVEYKTFFQIIKASIILSLLNKHTCILILAIEHKCSFFCNFIHSRHILLVIDSNGYVKYRVDATKLTMYIVLHEWVYVY